MQEGGRPGAPVGRVFFGNDLREEKVSRMVGPGPEARASAPLPLAPPPHAPEPLGINISRLPATGWRDPAGWPQAKDYL